MNNIGLIVVDLVELGGTQRVTVILANELRKRYKCHIITLYGNSYSFKVDNSVEIYNLNQNFVRLRYSMFGNLRCLTKYIKNNNIKILFVIGRNCTFLPLLLKFFCNIKIIFCEHQTLKCYDFHHLSFKQKIINGFLQSLIIKNSNKIVTLTKKEADYIKKRFFLNDYKVINIYNSLDENLLNDLLPYDKSNNKIITVGRIDYQKGYEYLVEVAKEIFEKHPDWEWHIYGDGEQNYKNEIIDLIKQNNLENHIILKGSSCDIYDLYQDYSFYVMTSRYEGLPMVLLEAKAKKLPIVSFDINSGPSDIIRDGVDGFLIKTFDCEAMANKICELIENPELRQKLSDNAHGNLDKFSKEKIIKQWCDLIDGL